MPRHQLGLWLLISLFFGLIVISMAAYVRREAQAAEPIGQ